MQVKILNKNRINENLGYELSNIQAFNIDEGFVYTKNYNETLDSCVIRLSHLPSEIDIEPYDEILLSGDSRFSDIYMCVSDYQVIEDSIDQNTKTYTYQINAFSQTKLLEGVIMPNLSITPLKTAKRSVYDYLKEYNDLYGAKIRTGYHYYNINESRHIDIAPTSPQEITLKPDKFKWRVSDPIDLVVNVEGIQEGTININYTENEIAIKIYYAQSEEGRSFDVNIAGTYTTAEMVNKYNYSQDVIDRFSNITAPELQWNAPTLREVINDLMMIDDCIATLNNGVIGFLDLTLTHNPITNYNYIQKSQSSEDYISEIRMNLQNVFNTKEDNIVNTTVVEDWTPIMYDGALMTSENFTYKTRFPILNIKHLWVGNFIFAQEDGELPAQYFAYEDMCAIKGEHDTKYSNFVKEEKEYQTLPVVARYYNTGTHITYEDLAKYQNFNLYFNRSGNEIKGFTTKTKFGTDAITAIETNNVDILQIYLLQYGTWRNGKDLTTEMTADFNTYTNTYIRIEYETTQNQTFSASKGQYPSNAKVIVDNQTNSWVDGNIQANLEYQKANRLGNKQMLINQRVSDNSYIGLGDTLNDNIVYKVDYQIYSEFIGVNAYATKDYILRDYFTGINSKIRTWKNATDEAFERHDLIKYYLEFAVGKDDIGVRDEYGVFRSDLARYFISPLESTEIKPIKSAFIKTSAMSNYYTSDLVNRMLGNSIVLTTGFNDNTTARNSINMSENVVYIGNGAPYVKAVDSQETGILTSINKYVDDNYETEYFNICYATNVDNNIVIENGGAYTDNETKAFIENTIQYPNEVRANFEPYIKLEETRYFIKDNKEIPVITLQYEFCTENRDIYFTKYFIKEQEAIREVAPTTLNFYVGSNNTFKYGKETLPTDAISFVGSVNINSDSGNYCEIIIGGRNFNVGETVYITNSDNVVMLAYKVSENAPFSTIYLNALKDRNKIVYNDNKIRQGEI